MKHLPAIDGLRAIAVLAVVAYHAGLPVPAGFVGVDVFFVISGYVITRMLAAEHGETGRIDFAAFYARRVRRILPALVVVVAAVLLVSAWLLTADAQLAVTRSTMAAMGFVANVYFQATTGGYWDAASDQMPLLHLWSLAVEEQFYILWPLLLIVSLRRRWLLVALAAGSFWLAQAWPTQVAFYEMPSRFWELAVGGLLALAPARSNRLTGPAGLVLLAVAVAVPLDHFPGDGAVPAVLGAALVLHAVHGGLRVPVLELRPVRWVGLISYGLYLWHWPLLAIAKASSLDPPGLTDNLALCALAVVLAAASYYWIETPIRRGQSPKVKAIGAGVLACLLVAGCAGGMETALRRSDSLSVRTALDGPKNAACVGPDAQCEADVVLWGDSHAQAWEPYAERFGAVHQLTWPGCVAAVNGAQNDACDAFNARALPVAEHARVVMLGGYWLRRLGSEKTREALASAIAAVAPHVQKVVIMGPVPELPHTPQQCIGADDYSPCSVSRAEFDRRAAPVWTFLRAEAAKYPNVAVIDPSAFFCGPDLCPMMKDGYSLYWDDDHISATAARNFTPRKN